jgi:hypothetical protein
MATKYISLKKYLENEVRMRFSKKSILPYDDNEVIHQVLKEESVSENLKIMNSNIFKLSKNILINTDNSGGEDVSFYCDITQSLLKEFNLTPTKEDFQKIREKNIKICLVGYGGAMVNMLYNMYLWAIELSELRIFENIIVFEKDTLDFSNLVRFGKPMAFDYFPLLASQKQAATGINILPKTDLISIEKELSRKRKIISFSNWLTDQHISKLTEKNYVLVGAPDLETRRILYETDANFYLMGHADYGVGLTYQPNVTSGLVNETYGSIDIPVLLVNLQLATAAFIKQLAGDSLPEKNEKLFSFDMKEYLKGKEDA